MAFIIPRLVTNGLPCLCCMVIECKNKLDHNDDGFFRHAIGTTTECYNRWRYNGTKNMEAQLGVKMVLDQRNGGQNNYTEAHKGNRPMYMVQR
jgi:hypothetical protein